MTSNSSVWQGKLVRLRAFAASDWEVYFAWDQDDEQARRLYTIPFPQSPAAVREWAEREASRTRDGDDSVLSSRTLLARWSAILRPTAATRA